MMLSMPSTTSSAVRVASAIQASGWAIHSNMTGKLQTVGQGQIAGDCGAKSSA